MAVFPVLWYNSGTNFIAKSPFKVTSLFKKLKQNFNRNKYKLVVFAAFSCLIFGGYFVSAQPVKAVGCEELADTSYLKGALAGDKYVGVNKAPDAVLGLDEQFTVYFSATATNGPGNPPDPNWTNCGDFSAQKYVLEFYIYPTGQSLATQRGGASVKPQFATVANGVTVKGGFTTTVNDLWDDQLTGETKNFSIYAYLCPNTACPGGTVSSLDSVDIKTDGKPGDRGTPSDDTIIDDPNAISTATPLNAALGASERSSAGGTILEFFASIIATIIRILTTLIYWLFAFVIAPLIEALLGVHPYQDAFVQVIYPGWLILRNLSNILFIIILLVIGLATLFQVEKYNYKHLLVKVVISAVAVNFSLVIGQSVLGIADTVQNQFLPERLNVVRALGYELMVKPVAQLQENTNAASSSQSSVNTVGGGLSNLTYAFFLFALALGAFFAFLAILRFFNSSSFLSIWVCFDWRSASIR